MTALRVADRRPGRVLVAGAINTDFVFRMRHAPASGETITGSGFAIHPGGKGANQAVAVARCGARVAILGGVGDDGFGTARLDDLRADGVEVDWVARLAGEPSGVAAIFVEESGDNRIAYVPGVTALVPAGAARAAVEGVAPAVVLSTNELRPDTLLPLFQEARRRSIPVVFNATPDPEAGRSLLPHVDVLVVNRGEAAALGIAVVSDGSAKLNEGAGTLAVPSFVVTLGELGAIGRDGDRWFRHPSIDVAAVDTTAAGDSFCGALTARLLDGATVSDAVRFAVVAGALATTKAGAQPSIPRRAEIERRLPDVAG